MLCHSHSNQNVFYKIHELFVSPIFFSEERAEEIKKQNIEQHQSRNRIRMTRLEEAENR